MNPVKRIFIIGHPGIGKGLVAKLLADNLGWELVNADLELENRIGRSMEDIAGDNHESAFYQNVIKILSAQSSRQNIVVNTDPHIICLEKARQLLAGEFVVYLKASTATQIARIARNSLPLLPIDNIHSFFERLHQERDHLYEETATLIIDTDNHALENHVQQIFDAVTVEQSVQSGKKDTQLVLFHKIRHTPVKLSPQQTACVILLAQGMTAKEIAKSLNISFRTVEGTLAKVMDITGGISSKELIALYHDKP